MSEMPGLLAWPLAVSAVGYGAWLGHRESRRDMRRLVWPPGGSPTIDGHAGDEARLHWRGPIAFLRWRDSDGRVQRLAWWPDVLSAAARRELRLAALDGAGAAAPASMAP